MKNDNKWSIARNNKDREKREGKNGKTVISLVKISVWKKDYYTPPQKKKNINRNQTSGINALPADS